MPRSMVRLAVAASALAVLPACTKNLVVTYPGNNAVAYPWRSCGQDCVNAFAELEETHTASGEACDELVRHAVDISGGDDRVGAAALYDSALVLILRGQGSEAGDRFAKAEALDSDPEYKRLERLYRDSDARFPAPVAPAPAASPPAAMPSSTPSAPAMSASPVVTPASAPSATPPHP